MPISAHWPALFGSSAFVAALRMGVKIRIAPRMFLSVLSLALSMCSRPLISAGTAPSVSVSVKLPVAMSYVTLSVKSTIPPAPPGGLELEVAAGVPVTPRELADVGGEPPGTVDCICAAKSTSPEISANTTTFFSKRSLMLSRRTDLGFGLDGGAGGAGGVPDEPSDCVTVNFKLLVYVCGVGSVESVTVITRDPVSCGSERFEN